MPVSAVLILAAVVAIALAIKFGAVPAATAGALLLLGVAGAAARFAPAAGALTQIAVLALIALGVLGLFRVRPPAVISVFTVGFLVLASVSAVVVTERSLELAFRGWVSLVAAVFAAIAVASASAPAKDGSRKGRDLILSVLVVVVVLNILFALRQALFGLSAQEIAAAEAAESTFQVGDQIRLMGLFATNQDFGLFSACLAPALLVLGLSRQITRRRWFIALSVAAYFAILLSLTRTALIAAIGTGLLALILWGQGRIGGRILRTTATVGVVATVGFGIVSSIQNARVQDSLARALTLLDLSGDTSFLARANRTLPRAFDAFFTNPWGSGAGAAGPVSQSFPTLVPFGPLTTDNGYLLIAVQSGLFGVIAFVGMLISIAVWLGRSTSPYARAGAASVTALLIAMFFAQYWGLLAPVSLAAAVVGMGIADVLAQPAETRTTTQRPSLLVRSHPTGSPLVES